MMKKSSVIFALVLVFAACVVLFQFAGTYDEYSRYNTNWNGTSDFFAGAGQQYIYEYTDLDGLVNTTMLVIAPSVQFADDTGQLRDYVVRGNTLIIADQKGRANSVLLSLGSDMQVSGVVLKSADKVYNDDSMFEGEVVESGTVLGSVGDTLFVNYPSFIEGGTPVLISSNLTWEVGNSSQDLVEMKPYSLAAYNSIGNGTVLVIADPSIFINSMGSIQYTANRAVLDTLQSMPGMYLEQKNSATVSGGGIFGILPTLMKYPALAAAVIALVALGCAAVFLRIDRKKRE